MKIKSIDYKTFSEVSENCTCEFGCPTGAMCGEISCPFVNKWNSLPDCECENTEVYMLMADLSGTTFSSDEPLGVAVQSKDEAEKFVKEGGVGFTHSYKKLKVFKEKDTALSFRRANKWRRK